MSNINKAFQQKDPSGKPRSAFIGFLTGGDPSMEKSEEFVLEMIRAGADLVEIGVPFSDPIAEGPVIQEANIRALSAGATVEKLFGLVKSLRSKTDVPLVFLTYLNPVFHYGYDPFFKRARDAGLDGIIIPDLPFEEQPEVRESASKYGVDIISLIAPTSEARIKEIAKAATGYIYLVSSMGVTGVRSEIKTDLGSIIAALRETTKIPVAVGFGIHTPAQAAEIGKIADGVIVGSAIVKIIAEHGADAGNHVYEYVRRMKIAVAGE
ncbi:tryptophan synthase, alpha subunit [Treponema primitia ZAS-2]|uniref:Tryptophan synthase alpha chain n=1 Tax=Treponema primitia (strain ATCC BAA-887 / DSM 12427 / ZAS-2) TaxID=545694 RepID=F5YMB3_TREPZ|nr:tryptophan synthase subunit alpha [Treponema primitia]AEF84768.1 tryptophan synthase, alpha subunit [Treponema primitia ZAS-2]